MLGVLALRDIGRFQHEAFGHYRRAALYMRLAIAFMLLVLVWLHADWSRSGAWAAATAWPVEAAGVTVWRGLAQANIAFIFLALMARELRRIVTGPRPVKP